MDGPQPDGPRPDGPRADSTVDSSTSDSTVDSASPDTTVDAGATSDTHGGPFAGQTIPDPGTGTADWVNTLYENHETPSKAWKVGVVTQNNPYVTMDMHSSGYAYLVFRTGPSFTRFDIDMGGSTNTIGVNFVHLHDGAGLKLGNAITPIYSTNTTGGWNVQPNHIYVLEISSAGAGFV